MTQRTPRAGKQHLPNDKPSGAKAVGTGPCVFVRYGALIRIVPAFLDLTYEDEAAAKHGFETLMAALQTTDEVAAALRRKFSDQTLVHFLNQFLPTKQLVSLIRLALLTADHTHGLNEQVDNRLFPVHVENIEAEDLQWIKNGRCRTKSTPPGSHAISYLKLDPRFAWQAAGQVFDSYRLEYLKQRSHRED